MRDHARYWWGLPAVLLLPIVWGGPAMGAEARRVQAPVRSATLYPQGAEVVRAVQSELPEGRHGLVIVGLPADLDPASIRIAVTPSDLVDLRGFRTRLHPATEYVGPRERALQAKIERLEDEIRLREDRIRAARIQLRLVERIGEAAADIATRQLGAGQPQPGDWRKSWEAVGSGAIEILEVIRQNESEKHALERELEARKQELEQLRTGARATRELVLDLEAQKATSVAVELRHFVKQAGWTPLYEARLRTRKGELALERRAEIWQKTGEDWRGVSLRLSTTRPRGTVAPPSLKPWYVDVIELRALAGKRAPAPGAPEATGALSAGAVAVERRVEEFSTIFIVSRPVDLLADGSKRVVTLTRDQLSADLLVEATPKLDPTPYLTARFTYADAEPLLPGSMRLVRDGAYVGETRLDFVVAGQEIRLGFGRDDKVEITHRMATDFKSEEGIVKSYRRIERRWVIGVRNRHERAIPIVVYDQLPTPKDERITVELLPDSTPPTERDVDGKPGVLAWRYEYQPGERREIRFGFAVIFPKDLEIGGL